MFPPAHAGFDRGSFATPGAEEMKFEEAVKGLREKGSMFMSRNNPIRKIRQARVGF